MIDGQEPIRSVPVEPVEYKTDTKINFPPSTESTEERTFLGVVFMKDWITNPWNNSAVRLIAGLITVREQTEVVGFKVSRGESNWVAQVSDGDKNSISILGCQIRAIMETDNLDDIKTVDAWRLL